MNMDPHCERMPDRDARRFFRALSTSLYFYAIKQGVREEYLREDNFELFTLYDLSELSIGNGVKYGVHIFTQQHLADTD